MNHSKHLDAVVWLAIGNLRLAIESFFAYSFGAVLLTVGASLLADAGLLLTVEALLLAAGKCI